MGLETNTRDTKGIADMDTPKAKEVGACQVFIWVPEFDDTSLLRQPLGQTDNLVKVKPRGMELCGLGAVCLIPSFSVDGGPTMDDRVPIQGPGSRS